MKFENLFIEKFEYGQKEIFEIVLYSSFAFLLPLLLTHLTGFANQLLVGSLVNFLLVMSAFYVSGWKTLPIILLPSIGAYFSGFVFGSISPFLLFLIPAIWIGNAIYIYFVKKFSVVEKNPVKGLFYSSISKSLFLFLFAGVLVFMNLIPNQFLFAMGPLQLLTAITGGVFALFANKIRNNERMF